MAFVDQYHNKYQTGGLQHLLARYIRQEVGSGTFDSYFKFAIVRNPWDRVISQYAFMSKRKDLCEFIGMNPGDSLHRYLQLIAKKQHVQWEQQVSFLRDVDGQLLVDFVGRFENFELSLREILGRIHIPVTTVPHDNKGKRGRYQEYYDSETREMVSSIYAADIEAFGYSFDGVQQSAQSGFSVSRKCA